MAAVLSDKHGIFAWGWNSAGPNGSGEHAEEAAFRRANRRRLRGAVLTVAGDYKRNSNPVHALPCMDRCQKIAFKYGISKIEFRDRNGQWQILTPQWL